jgi:hypothetical protein
MAEDSERKGGRPKNTAPSHTIEIRTVDAITFRMLETLVSYGRFGDSKQQVALFIIRQWLLENEDSLKRAIAARKFPLGDIDPDTEDSPPQD